MLLSLPIKSISLRDGYAQPLDGPTEVGTGMVREEPMVLSRLIDLVNQRFGTDFNQADQLFFGQLVEAAIRDEFIIKAAEIQRINSSWFFRTCFNHCS